VTLSWPGPVALVAVREGATLAPFPGLAPGDATSGLTQMAGISVGASFVDAAAGALAVADPLRSLQDGGEFSVEVVGALRVRARRRASEAQVLHSGLELTC
jgi:hypothetical protein